MILGNFWVTQIHPKRTRFFGFRIQPQPKFALYDLNYCRICRPGLVWPLPLESV